MERMLATGIIQHSQSDWIAGIVLVRKKDDRLRVYVDYRVLAMIQKDKHHFLNSEETIDKLVWASIFSMLDANARYHQFEV